MSTYATELAALKHHALRTLYQVLQTATDPAELRRTATAILRIPDPKPETQSNPKPKTEPEPAVKPASESEGLIVSSRAVERGSASDTPGTATTSEPHSEGVPVAPEYRASSPPTAHSPPRSLSAPDPPLSRAPPHARPRTV